MKKSRNIVLGCFGVCTLLALLGFAWNGKSDDTTIIIQSPNPDEYDYLLHWPKRTDNEPLPLIVFLHGSGEIGAGFNVLKKRDLHRWMKRTMNPEKFSFVVVSPLATHEGWSSGKIARLVERLCEDKRIDHDRIYLTGFSMGGGATFRIASEYPDLFAAVVPVAGSGCPDDAASLQKMPIWAFHGEQDNVLPAFLSCDMIDAIRSAGNPDATLTILPSAGHGIAEDVYSRPEIYEWMLRQWRKK